MKIAIVVALARVTKEHNDYYLIHTTESELQYIWKCMKVVVPPALLVLLQNDTGVVLIILVGAAFLSKCPSAVERHGTSVGFGGGAERQRVSVGVAAVRIPARHGDGPFRFAVEHEGVSNGIAFLGARSGEMEATHGATLRNNGAGRNFQTVVRREAFVGVGARQSLGRN